MANNISKVRKNLTIIIATILFTIGAILLAFWLVDSATPFVEMCNSDLDFFEKEKRGCFG